MWDGLLDSLKKGKSTTKYVVGMVKSEVGRKNAVLGGVNWVQKHPIMFVALLFGLFSVGLYSMVITFAVGVPSISVLGYDGATTLFSGIDAVGIVLTPFKRFMFQVMMGVLGMIALVKFALNYFRSIG